MTRLLSKVLYLWRTSWSEYCRLKRKERPTTQLWLRVGWSVKLVRCSALLPLHVNVAHTNDVRWVNLRPHARRVRYVIIRIFEDRWWKTAAKRKWQSIKYLKRTCVRLCVCQFVSGFVKIDTRNFKLTEKREVVRVVCDAVAGTSVQELIPLL